MEPWLFAVGNIYQRGPFSWGSQDLFYPAGSYISGITLPAERTVGCLDPASLASLITLSPVLPFLQVLSFLSMKQVRVVVVVGYEEWFARGGTTVWGLVCLMGVLCSQQAASDG